MPIDASIPLQAKGIQLESPVNQLAMLNEATKFGEMNRAIDTQNKLRELYSQGIDVSTPEGFKQHAAIDPMGAMKLRNEAWQGQKLQGEIKKTGFEIDEKKLGIIRERSKDLLQNLSPENFIAHTQENVRDGLVTAEQGQRAIQNYIATPPNQRAALINQNLAKSEDIYKQFQENMRHATPSGSAIVQAKATLGAKQESEFEKTLGGKQAEALVKSREGAQDAASILQTNEVGRKILNSGAITGSGADFFVGLNQALKTAGIDAGYADAAANSQAYGATMASNVGKLIKQYGAGTGLSDADREFATKAAAGSINMDEKAIRKVLDINDRAARNVITEHNKKAEGIKTNVPLKVEMPGGVAPMYATNGTQRIVSNDGGATWQPVGAK